VNSASVSLLARVLSGSRLLPLRSLRRLGRTIAWVADRLSLRAALTTRTNLALCMPALNAAERRRLAQASLAETGALALECARAWTDAPAQILALVDPGPDIERFRTALTAQRGLLLLVPHLGNWEVLNLWLQDALAPDARLTALYEPLDDPALDAWVHRCRERTGARLVPAGSGGLRTLVRALEEGGVATLLPDQVPRGTGALHAPFYGRPACTMTLPGRLLQRTGAAVLAATALRTRAGFELRFLEPPSQLADPDPMRAAGALNQCLERCIDLAPAQYQWAYKRFKHPPPGVVDYYKRRPPSS